MTNELRISASSSALSALLSAMPNLVPVRIGKNNCYALDTGVKDENGNTVYVTIDLTVKNTEPTKTAPAFDYNAAVEAYGAWVAEQANKPPKGEGSSKRKADAEANAAKREAACKVIRDWVAANMTEDDRMTATDFKNAIPEFADESIMQVGTLLKMVVADGITLDRETEKGKNYYTKHQ